MGKVNSLFMDEQERHAELRRAEIADERGLHLDDDADQIEDILICEAERAWEERSPPDDTAYRKHMIEAGRGHLIR